MKLKKKARKTAILMAVVTVFAMAPLLLGNTQPVYAEWDDPALSLGTGALDKNVNTSEGFYVYFGGGSSEQDWWVINYDGKGNSAVKKSGVMTLFARSGHSYNKLFNDAGGSNAYGGSRLQQAMDNEVNRMFSAAEKNAIRPRTLAGGSADYGQSGYDSNKIKGSTVEDAYLWPLSVAEANATPQTILDGFSTRDLFWLRSPGQSQDGYAYAAYVSDSGEVIEEGTEVNSYFDIQGACDIDLDAVLFTSGQYFSSVGADALEPVGFVNGDNKSLTLLDNARKNFGVDSVTSINDGKTLQIKYSGAVAGERNYVSAIIVNSSNDITYYGKLALASTAADATVEVNIDGKWDRENGDKLYVFNEEYNGVDRTDYSSDLQEITASMIGDDGSWTGDGTAKNPYVISGKNGWNHFSEFVNNGNSTQGVYFALGDNIRVDQMVGVKGRPFRGVFDGAGYTLTFNAENHPEGTAPFAYTHGATIRNLHVAGTITGNDQRASGLIGENSGISTVTNCRVSAEISGGQLVGGFCIGVGNGTLIIDGCVFDGKITGSDQSGGFAAWAQGGILAVTNSMFAPQKGSSISGGTFYFNGNTAALNNCLYMAEVGTAQGKLAHSITAGTGVSAINFGTGTEYGVSGIKAYNTGLVYKGVFYAGKDDQVPVTLADAGSSRTYEVSAGTITGSGKNYRITMPDDDVVISCRYTKIAAPKNVKIEVTASENGLLPETEALTAKWSAVDGAEGYYITPYQIQNGAEKDICGPIKIDYPNVSGGIVSFDLTGKTTLSDDADFGKYAFKVRAYNGSTVSNEIKASNQAEVYRIHMKAGTEWDTFHVLKGAGIAACITEIFLKGENGHYQYNGKQEYYYSEGTERLKMLAFIPKQAAQYHSIDALKADAFLVPGESSSNAAVSGNVDVYSFSEADLCSVDSNLHDFAEDAVEMAAAIGPDAYGRVVCHCTKCNKQERLMIAPVTQFALAKTTYTFTGKAIKPAVTVKDASNQALKSGQDYTISYSGNTQVGTAKVEITLTGMHYKGSKTLTFKINKAANPLAVKGKTVKIKYKKLKKKSKTLKTTKVIKFINKGQGTKTYVKASGNKKITINKKTGKVTVKKGLKKGTYKVKVKVKAAGNANYKPSTVKTATIIIKVIK